MLRIAGSSTWPWDRPTFTIGQVDKALEKATRIPSSIVEVHVPLWRRFLETPYPDTLSVSVQEIPSTMGGIRLVILCASSDSAAALVANLYVALRAVRGDPDELVKSLETRSTSGETYMHAIACIPGSVRG